MGQSDESCWHFSEVKLHYMKDVMELKVPSCSPLHHLQHTAGKQILGLRAADANFYFYVEAEAGGYLPFDRSTTVEEVLNVLFPNSPQSLRANIRLSVKIAGAEQEVDVCVKDDGAECDMEIKRVFVSRGSQLSDLRSSTEYAKGVSMERLCFLVEVDGVWIVCNDGSIGALLAKHSSADRPPHRLRVRLLVMPQPAPPSVPHECWRTRR